MLKNWLKKLLVVSGNCNIDVNCPLGQGWENQRNAVACVVAGGGICSGSMVNNTSGTIIPYYLSANHCGTSPGSWVFRFRWERAAQHVICAQTNSTANNGPTNMTVNGGVLRANNSGSDFILVELNSAPNPTWGIYYNGWDRSDALTVTQATGIHHPSGDIKKICRENDPLTQQTTSFNGNPNTKVWRVANWDQGVTEPVHPVHLFSIKINVQLVFYLEEQLLVVVLQITMDMIFTDVLALHGQMVQHKLLV
jgi:lysyl endopeptidase